MRKVNKTTLVEKFNRKEEERSEENDAFVFVCTGGGEKGCSTAYRSNNEGNFKNHINKIHPTESEALKEEKRTVTFNKAEEHRTEEEAKFIFVCKESDFMGNEEPAFYKHIYSAHIATDEQRALVSLTHYSRSNVTTNATLKKLEKVPLLEIEPESSQNDVESASYLEFHPILQRMKEEEEEKNSSYQATLFVAYFSLGKVEKGPMETYEFEDMLLKLDESLGQIDDFPFTFYLYFGTCCRTTCTHLTEDDAKKEQSLLVNLIKDGAVCYRQDFVFEGGTTEQNREAAFQWQQFWKFVNQFRQRVKKHPYSVGIEILNVGLKRKVGYRKRITDDNFHKAGRFATQNRTFFPLPLHLLPVTTLPPFVKYTLEK